MPSIPDFRVKAGFSCSILLLALVLGCSSDSGLGPGDPVLDEMAGVWDAREFTVTSVAVPSLSFDVVALGGSFRLDIEPSGRYAGSLMLEGVSQTELGVIEVDGGTLIQTPTNPPGDPVTIEWGMPDDNTLLLDGETEFDFNFDGQTEPARVYIDLERR